MSGANLVKFHLGALDRIREDAAFACKTNLPSRLGPELDSRGVSAVGSAQRPFAS